MHYKPIIALLLPAIASASSTSVLSTCLTFYGSTSKHPLPTEHATFYKTFTQTLKSTSTPVSTVTPPVSTTTQTDRSTSTSTTTLDEVGPTFTTTSVVYSISTIISQTTVTATATSTTMSTTFITYTNAPSAGFTPLGSELATMGDTYAKRGIEQLRGRAPGEIGQRNGRRHGASGSPGHSRPKSYPDDVRCDTLTEVFVATTSTVKALTTQTTTLQASTTTVTVG